jgi:hypothetical protein
MQRSLFGCVVSAACAVTLCSGAFDAADIGKYRDETFVELPYTYKGYLDAPLTPEVAIKIFLNPCEGSDAGCCANRYGIMEYFPEAPGIAQYQVDRVCLYEGRSYPIECVQDHTGVLMSYEAQRLSDYDLFFNSSCTGKCVGIGLAVR